MPGPGSDNADLLVASDISRHFAEHQMLARRGSARPARAVDGVSLTLRAGRISGLAGESGCGKTTLARILVGLDHPTSGQVTIDGQDLHRLRGTARRRVARSIQMVFQDSTSSLNPRRTVASSIAMPLTAEGGVSRKAAREHVTGLLEEVGLTPADRYIDRYPHQLSGGQRQRVVIARALATRPRFIVADEPVSALDSTVQAKIVALLRDVAQAHRIGVLFISHDLSVLRSVTSDISVMYLGRIVEYGDSAAVLKSPQHPYTKALLSAAPVIGKRRQPAGAQTPIRGEVPSLRNIPAGCRFHPRCAIAEAVCSEADSELQRGSLGWAVACHLAHDEGR